MENLINIEKFCQYFFYGLDNQEEIIKGLIEQEAVLQKESLYQEESNILQENKNKKYQENKHKLNTIQRKIKEETILLQELTDAKQIKLHKENKYNLEIELFERKKQIEKSIENEPILLNSQIERAAKLLVQFRRFISLNDTPFNKKYVFNFNDEIEPAKEEIKQQLKLIRKDYNNKKSNIFYIDYAPMSGIFYNGKKPSQDIWVQEVLQILKYLQDLEKNNIFQYYSTFIDVKYARAIHRIQTGQIKNDEEKEEIKNVYRIFLKRKTSFRSRY